VSALCVAAFMIAVILHFFWRMQGVGRSEEPGILSIVSVRDLGGGWVEVTRRVAGVMSTSAKLVAQGRERKRLVEATLEAARALLQIEKRLSRFRADSELRRLCARAHKSPVKVSREMAFLLGKALYWARRSDGALDITCVPLLEVYSRAAKQKRQPTDKEIKTALRQLGWKKIHLDGRMVRFDAPLRLDLGALAKGFAAQKAVEVMRACGVEHCLAEVGGEVFVSGGRYDATPWRVGIKDPRKKGAMLSVVALKDGAVATSGNYERYFATGGKRHSHIVDPRTGRTADCAVSVTVVAPDGTDADALATALSVLGPKNGLSLIEKLKKEGMRVEALFLWRDGRGERVLRSSGFGVLEVR